jgi:hypothetical protein
MISIQLRISSGGKNISAYRNQLKLKEKKVRSEFKNYFN